MHVTELIYNPPLPLFLIDEVYQLSERTGERRPDPGVERRVEQVRRELLGEVQLLQSQLQLTSAKGSNSHMSDSQVLALNRDFLDMWVLWWFTLMSDRPLYAYCKSKYFYIVHTSSPTGVFISSFCDVLVLWYSGLLYSCSVTSCL